MKNIAIIGSGPAGFYTAEAAGKLWGGAARVDIIEALPVPFGLIRTGVAPDHQSIKAVAKRFEQTYEAGDVNFLGNIMVGRDVSIPELLELYDAVVLATGAPLDKPLNLDGDDLPNIFGSSAFVGWYNGHPKYADLAPNLQGEHAVIIGMGNVALDVARILAKTEAEFAGSDIVAHALAALKTSTIKTITIVGRRGPHQIMMTPKELAELGKLERASVAANAEDFPPEEEDLALEPGLRKSVTILRGYAENNGDDEKPIKIIFDLFASPIGFSSNNGRQNITLEHTIVKDGKASGTGEHYHIPADIVISCIGYRTSPIPDVPYDERKGAFANEEGRISPRLYCVGWARRGPSGTIGTNKPDGFAIIDRIAEDYEQPAEARKGRDGLKELLMERDVRTVTFNDWKAIESAEITAARSGAPREKFVDVEAMLGAGLAAGVAP